MLLVGFVFVVLAMLDRCFTLSYIPDPDLKLNDTGSSKTKPTLA